jgi:hypothetical protein
VDRAVTLAPTARFRIDCLISQVACLPRPCDNRRSRALAAVLTPLHKVPDGTSVETASEEGFIESLESLDALSDTYLQSEVTEEGTERVITTTLDVAGTWLVNCFVFNNPDGEDFPATTFEVVEQS